MSEDAIVTETTTTPNTPWYHNIQDTEIRGALETKGWSKLDPAQAVEQAVRAHRNAEKMLGAPADNLLRLPARDDDEAGWRNVWNRLGAPEKAEDYSFADLKLRDDAMTQRLHDALRQTAHELGMPKAMAERIAGTMHKFVNDTSAAADAENAAAQADENTKLQANWGPSDGARFKANMFVADQAAEKLGVPQEILGKLKDGMGAAGVAEMFHKIGLAMGEDKYVAGSNPTNNGVMSREQAVARKAELMSDKDWVGRYLKGGAPEKREMTALEKMIVAV